MEPVADEDLSTGAYGGSRPRGADLETPPAHAHDGMGHAIALPELEELAAEERSILEAISAESDWMTEVLADLIRAPSVLGNEETGQEVVRQALRDLGLEPLDVAMDAERIRTHPGHSPFDWDVSAKRNVVATWFSGDTSGHSS